MSYKFGDSKFYIVYFKVPYDKKDDAKKEGYFWDAEKKCWFRKLYVNKTNSFRLLYSLCDKNNSSDIFEIFNNIKLSQEETKDTLYSV
jgi:hypothetical protein